MSLFPLVFFSRRDLKAALPRMMVVEGVGPGPDTAARIA